MKKGFTLIELLAVIIILAIVALVAIPIILNVMDDARKSAGLSETYIIYDGINNYCRTSEIKKETGTLTTDDIDCSTKTTFTNEEINKMINLGNAEVLENTFGTRKLTWLKVKSNGYIYIIDSSGNVEAIKEDGPEPIPPIDDTPITDTVVPDIVCDGENSCSGSVVDVVLVPDPDPGTDESNEINYEITIYTVGYITEGHVNSGIKGTTYTINIDNIPLDLNEYTLELVSSSVMTTQEDFNNYKQLKKSGRPAMDMEGANADNSAVATVQELYEHSLNENQLVIDGIRVSCDTTKCQATINESFQNLTNLNYHETTTAKGDALKVVYPGKKFTLRATKRNTADTSGANAPELDTNMVPIKYDGSNWVYADTSEAWYNYDNKEWANAVVLNSGVSKNVGDTITENEIALWYVWIPRYKYQLFNADNGSVSEQLINIEFESGTASTGTVNCTDAVSGSGSSSETCTNASNGNWYTHPAFTFGEEEITGFWVGKFEVSGSTSQITIKPNVSSLRDQTVSSFFTSIQNMKTTYGLSGDSHMIKNMEWGAVAYLKQSKYGLGETDIGINNNSSYITGCGATAGSSSSSTCDAYNTTNGMLTSTTGNIYGVYDMSGGAWEYVMGNMVNSSGAFYASNSGFSSAPDTKYYDAYTYGTSITDHGRGKLGDATKETLATFGNTSGWYSDHAVFVYSIASWFDRGGRLNDYSSAGVFSFNGITGWGGSGGSSRAVLVP